MQKMVICFGASLPGDEFILRRPRFLSGLSDGRVERRRIISLACSGI